MGGQLIVWSEREQARGVGSDEDMVLIDLIVLDMPSILLPLLLIPSTLPLLEHLLSPVLLRAKRIVSQNEFQGKHLCLWHIGEGLRRLGRLLVDVFTRMAAIGHQIKEDRTRELRRERDVMERRC
jgi:hypothetical protein